MQYIVIKGTDQLLEEGTIFVFIQILMMVLHF